MGSMRRATAGLPGSRSMKIMQLSEIKQGISLPTHVGNLAQFCDTSMARLLPSSRISMNKWTICLCMSGLGGGLAGGQAC